MRDIHNLWRRFYRFCVSFQVELRGNYTAERINSLNQYLHSTSTLRTLLTVALSPLPCLVIIALVDCVPLASPEEGSSANVAFWGRDFVCITLMTCAALKQIRDVVPGLNMTATHAAVITITTPIVSVSLMIGVSSVVGFPLPFALLVGMPGAMLVMIVGFGVFFGRVLKQNSALRKELINFANVENCPLILMLVHPVYLYGFNHLGSLEQNIYLGLLPLIRIIGKNWIRYFMDSKYDLMLPIMIFNVDVFNAMYISSCIQNSKSLSTIVLLITLDVFLAWISMTDLEIRMRSVVLLRRKVPAGHPLKRGTFIDLAAQIIKEDDRARVWLSQCHYSFGVAVLKLPDKVSNSSETSIGPAADIVSAFATRQVFSLSSMESDPAQTPIETFAQPSNQPKVTQHFGLEGVLSESERQRFVQQTAQLLFTTEFVILVLYTKFIAPFLFVVPAQRHQLPFVMLDTSGSHVRGVMMVLQGEILRGVA
ncbi:hypothetical protein PR003_g28739 [Phytophthora rubi]|uniref:Uncharacterized protein n=1 Tax=Phytophthora rubi TaxID=129364 RepID=A0A6A4BWI9_9STRA|nr:hypothetical protein PR002_g27827 [Phytophthora rubi]KAE8969078.1 hypothetical protein PR001_g27606 [Phytophthora rubi]KAE9277626.1 hypothetical protein PR003_g28739 [Phytophthora rubi]